MLGGIIFTIGSLFFMILLQFSYFSQESLNAIQNRLFRWLMTVQILLTVSEIIAVISAVYGDNYLLTLILYRIHWATGIVIFFFFYCYYTVYFGNVQASNLKDLVKRKEYFKVFILYIVFLIVFMFVPFSKISYHNLYMPGPAAYYMFATCTVAPVLNIIYLVRNKSLINKDKITHVIVMSLLLVSITVFQVSFKFIAFPPIFLSILIYYLYFKIENPDLINAVKLEEVKQKIEQSNQAKTDFLSNMSHEIRTPMNTIVGLSEGLLNSPTFVEKNTRQDLKNISVAGKNLLEIINNILDISKIESENETVNIKEYNLKTIISDLSALVKTKLEGRSIKYVLEVDPNTPVRLYGDSTKLFQVLLNLLNNAAKYTEVGKIKFRIQSIIKDNYVNLTFRISDTGTGIKKEDYDKLFEKFSRLDNATTKEIEGTGLGLVIAKKYVDLMGGKITFDSEYEVGTTFSVTINQKILGTERIGNIDDIVNEEKHIDFIDCSNKKVLIVDDNKLNCKVVTKLLESYKLEVNVISSAHDCIYKVKSGEQYDLIFMDYLMPDMDGIELMHVLKKLEAFNVPPIVCLTANALVGTKEAYLKEGFDDFLSKPVDLIELDKVIHKFLAKKKD